MTHDTISREAAADESMILAAIEDVHDLDVTLPMYAASVARAIRALPAVQPVVEPLVWFKLNTGWIADDDLMGIDRYAADEAEIQAQERQRAARILAAMDMQPGPVAQVWLEGDGTIHMQGRDGPDKAAEAVAAALAGIVQPAPDVGALVEAAKRLTSTMETIADNCPARGTQVVAKSSLNEWRQFLAQWEAGNGSP